MIDWTIIYQELTIVGVRGRGPGGQHVNRTSSSAQLKWPLYLSSALSGEQKNRLANRAKNQLNSEGEIYLRCDEFRDFERNKAKCWLKLKNLILKGLAQQKARHATKPTRASKERRLKSKTIRSDVKAGRRKPDHSE